MHPNQPAFFKQGPKPLTRFAIYGALSLALIVGDTQYQMLGRVREQVSVLLYPLQWLATAPFDLARNSHDFLTRQSELLAENRRLSDAQLVATSQNFKLQQLEIENKRLRELAETRRSLPQAGSLAEILYNARDPFAARLIVDRGESAGITPGRIVIDAGGVVGQVVRTQPLTSEVRLISDRNHMVPVMVERNQLRAVVYGMGRHQQLEVRNLASNVDIQVGDILRTSGLDSIYPAGLPVARIAHVERRAGTAFARIFCEPLAAIDRHRFLLVLEPVKPLPAYPAETAVPPATNKGK
jgi:rod shape-determining protein MreC